MASQRDHAARVNYVAMKIAPLPSSYVFLIRKYLLQFFEIFLKLIVIKVAKEITEQFEVNI